MKIYDLIYFERKNENAMIQKNGLQKKIFVISIVLGMIGTLCLMMRDLLLGIIGALCIIIFLYGFLRVFLLAFQSGLKNMQRRSIKNRICLYFVLCQQSFPQWEL